MKKDNFNIIYEALFAVWNISNFTENVEIFENKNDNFLETIVSVIKTNKIDKIARVGLMIIKVKLKYDLNKFHEFFLSIERDKLKIEFTHIPTLLRSPIGHIIHENYRHPSH